MRSIDWRRRIRWPPGSGRWNTYQGAVNLALQTASHHSAGGRSHPVDSRAHYVAGRHTALGPIVDEPQNVVADTLVLHMKILSSIVTPVAVCVG